MTLQLTSTRFGLPASAWKPLDANPQEEAGIGLRADEWVFYAARVRGCFDRINGIIGQLAGLLILGQARSCFEAYYTLAATPLEQIEACRCDLAAIHPPAIASHHHAHLDSAAARVDEIARSLRRSVGSPEQLRLEIPRMVAALEATCAMLRCAADPVLRLQTIDFSQGCACCAGLEAPRDDARGLHATNASMDSRHPALYPNNR